MFAGMSQTRCSVQSVVVHARLYKTFHVCLCAGLTLAGVQLSVLKPGSNKVLAAAQRGGLLFTHKVRGKGSDQGRLLPGRHSVWVKQEGRTSSDLFNCASGIQPQFVSVGQASGMLPVQVQAVIFCTTVAWHDGIHHCRHCCCYCCFWWFRVIAAQRCWM